MSKKNIKSKVAISTWWNYFNYGTALQVTALYNVIKRLGYAPDVVSYIPSGKRYPTNPVADRTHDENYRKFKRVKDSNRDKRFEDYLAKNLTFTQSTQTDQEFRMLNDTYDAFIVGSDQIWAPSVFDERYFLDYVRDNRKKISYAPSFGLTTVENIEVRDKMSKLLSQFANLSVREEQGAHIIRKELKIDKVEVMPDPTLLLTYKEWRNILPKPERKNNEKYIACYFLGESDQAWKHVQKLSKQTGYSVKIIPVFQKDSEYGDFVNGADPQDFLNILDDAQVVMTDSFHGAIFSIITRTPFYVFERFKQESGGSQNSRVYNLLNITGLSDRLIKYDAEVKQRYDLNIDFKTAESSINKERDKAFKYLRDSLTITSPQVSVIVPAYNVEKYIGSCLDSILNQTYENIEVIVVDDGSPDKAGEIADRYAQIDKRLKVIHQANGGLSAARNAGYDQASGEYIVFVDSDDALAPDYIEYMVSVIENTNTNMAMSINRYDVFNTQQIGIDKIGTVTADSLIKKIEYTLRNEQVWNKIYRKSYLDMHHIRHIPHILYGEGNTFNHHVLKDVGSVGVGWRRVYYYRFNPDSVTRSFVWNERRRSIEYALAYRKKAIKGKGKDIQIAFGYTSWDSAFNIIKGLISVGVESEFRDDYRKWRRILRRNVINVLKSDSSFVPRKIKIRALISFFFPSLLASRFMDGFEWEKRQRQAFENMPEEHFNIMPWELKEGA